MELDSTSDTTALVDGIRVKMAGAAAMKASEKAVEQFAGRKKSKFWYYAVEAATPSATATPPAVEGNGEVNHDTNGHGPKPMDIDSGSVAEAPHVGSDQPASSHT